MGSAVFQKAHAYTRFLLESQTTTYWDLVSEADTHLSLFFPIQRLATLSRSDKNLWTSEQVFAKQL